jgi:hypothetical protein
MRCRNTMKTPEIKRVIGQIVTDKHNELRDRPERLILIDHAMIGAVLYLCKQVLPPRTYVPWLKKHTSINQRAGARYMARMRQYLKTREEELRIEKEVKKILWP